MLWPPGHLPQGIVPYHRGDAALRGHAHTPLRELAGLAADLASSEPDGEIVRRMAAEPPPSKLRAGSLYFSRGALWNRSTAWASSPQSTAPGRTFGGQPSDGPTKLKVVLHMAGGPRCLTQHEYGISRE